MRRDAPRRTVAGTVALATVLAVVVAGCGTASTSDSGSGGGGKGGGSLSGSRAVFTTFGGPFDKPVQKAYVDPVEQATGLRISFDGPTDYSKLATQVKTRNVSWTVVMGDGFYSIANCGKTLQPIDKLIDRSQIDPRYVVSRCSAPGDAYTYVIVYDKKKFAGNPPKGWADFFDTARFPGKRGIWGAAAFNGALEGALLADGVAKDDLYPMDVDRAFKKLASIKKETSFYDSLATGQQQIEAGELSMAILPVTNGLNAAQNGADVAPVWTDSIRAFNDYVMPIGANPKLAKPLLQQIASNRGQDAIGTDYPAAGVTVKKYGGKLPSDPVLREWSDLVEDRVSQEVVADQQWWAKHLDATQNRWTAFVSG